MECGGCGGGGAHHGLGSPLSRTGRIWARSLIEIFASLVVVWQLTNTGHDRQRHALRLIGIAFFALALYILAQSGYILLTQAQPATSVSGIAWLGLVWPTPE